MLVTLAEATPVHEAAALARDLERAGIEPFAWVVNQSLTPLRVSDPVLVRRRASEAKYLREVAALSRRVALVPWASAEKWHHGRLDLLSVPSTSPETP